MPACEYCGDHFPKGGAHATHERNCGARPQPDEEEDVQNDEVEQTEPEIEDDAPDDPDPPADDNTIQMTDDEFDQMLTSVEEEAPASGWEEGIEQGYEAGLSEAQQTTSGGSSSTSSASTTTSGGSCPDCGGSLEYGKEKTLFFAINGRVLHLESTDGVCESCDIVVGDDGETYYGTESSKGKTTFACRECGEQVLDAEHAEAVLAVYYNGTSSLRVMTRRRLKKMAQRIDKSANYVCVSCWTAYG